MGVDLNAATEELQKEGVQKFEESLNELLAALDQKKRHFSTGLLTH